MPHQNRAHEGETFIIIYKLCYKFGVDMVVDTQDFQIFLESFSIVGRFKYPHAIALAQFQKKYSSG